jgi:amicyanin
MKKPWISIVVALTLGAALIVGGVVAVQAAMGAHNAATADYTNNGYGGMMGGNYGGGMMGGGGGMMGNGGMMGGYGNAQYPANATPATGNTVTIQNFAFQPANLQVKVGTTVTWTNQDTAPHTVTFRDSGMTGSAILQKGQSFSYTFNKVGTFAYYCQVHPGMTAQVVVTA